MPKGIISNKSHNLIILFNYVFVVSSNRTITAKFKPGILKFIATCTDGYILNYNDGNYTVVRVGTNNWSDISYGNGKYVVVGPDGNSAYSSDGINWTSNDALKPYNAISGFEYANSITYANGRFVVIGSGPGTNVNDGRYSTSSDGINWSDAVQYMKNTSIDSGYRIKFLNGRFIAICEDQKALSSLNGSNWTLMSTLPGYGHLIYQDGRYNLCCDGGTVYTSQDGITWNSQTVSGVSTRWNECCGACSGNGKSIALFANGEIATSNDGSTWNKTAKLDGTSWKKIIFSNNQFIAFKQGSYSVSGDGINWTTKMLPALKNAVLGACPIN